MAGHSKWSNIKRRKAAQDGKKTKIFTKVSREIIVATQQGGPNANENARLRLAIQNAKAVNLPKEKIERAIQKGSGQNEGTHYQKMTYEGYAPHGVAVMVEAMTDNGNRTVAAIRAVFRKYNGSLDKKGAIQHLFAYKGIFLLPPQDQATWQDQALELIGAGVEDIETHAEGIRLITPPEAFTSVQRCLETQHIPYEEAAIHYLPHSTVTLPPDQTDRVTTLLDSLEDLDDVQEVFHNLSNPT